MNAFSRLKAFACAVNDPRVERTKLHNLADMIVIAVYSLVCQACGWLDIATTAKDRINEIEIPLPNGIPSHDTFGRVFRRINPDELQTAISGSCSTRSSCSMSPATAGSMKSVRSLPTARTSTRP